MCRVGGFLCGLIDVAGCQFDCDRLGGRGGGLGEIDLTRLTDRAYGKCGVMDCLICVGFIGVLVGATCISLVFCGREMVLPAGFVVAVVGRCWLELGFARLDEGELIDSR